MTAQPRAQGLVDRAFELHEADAPGAALFNVHPIPFMEALRRALGADKEAPRPAG